MEFATAAAAAGGGFSNNLFLKGGLVLLLVGALIDLIKPYFSMALDFFMEQV